MQNSKTKELNRTLRNEFKLLKLDSFIICSKINGDMSRENKILQSLLDWVKVHRENPDQESM